MRGVAIYSCVIRILSNAMDGNSTNSSRLEQILISSTFALLSGASLIACLIFNGTILYSKELRASPFFRVMFSIVLNDIGSQLAYLTVAAPSGFLGFVYSSTTNIIVSSITMEIMWFHATLLLVFQSFNRLYSICYRDKYLKVFGGYRIWFFIGTAWGVGIIFGSITFMPCCHGLFFLDVYDFSYDGKQGARIISYVDVGYTMTNLTVVMVVNFVIFRDIFKRHNSIETHESQFEANRRRREVKLFMQLFVTTMLFVMGEFAYVGIPAMTASRGRNWSAS